MERHLEFIVTGREGADVDRNHFLQCFPSQTNLRGVSKYYPARALTNDRLYDNGLLGRRARVQLIKKSEQ